MKARTKPVEVEAVQWRGDNRDDFIAFFSDATFVWGDALAVHSPSEGYHFARPGTWFVRTAHLGVSTMTDAEFLNDYNATLGQYYGTRF